MGTRSSTPAEANAEAVAHANMLAAKKDVATRMYTMEAARLKTPGLSKAERTAIAKSAATYSKTAASFSAGIREITQTQRESQSLQTSVVVMDAVKAQAELGARIGKTIDVRYIKKKARKTAEAKQGIEDVKDMMKSDTDPNEDDEDDIARNLLEESDAATEFREFSTVQAMPSVPNRPVQTRIDGGGDEESKTAHAKR